MKMENFNLDMRHQHYELFIQEIEGIDDYWGPTFRAIYDGDEHKKFMEQLDIRIKSHDRDIERMCNFHYQGFIDSIRELLQVRSEAQKLNIEVVEMDKALQQSATKVKDMSEDLVRARKVEKNIAGTIENLSQCLPVLNTYAKLQKQMNEKRYYPALKTLEQLEHHHLPTVANYRFSHQMKENIPRLRESIKEASMSDLKDFLENIRKSSSVIGEIAMKHTAEQMGCSESSNMDRKMKYETYFPRNTFTDEATFQSIEKDSPKDLSAQDLLDFSPVYRCLHIFSVLSSQDLFETYYRKQRKKQARLVLQPPTNMHESISGYCTYMHSIVGFFVVEDHILNTTNHLVNRSYLDEIWGMALSKVINALRTHSAYCTDANLMLKIKNLIMLFSTTLRMRTKEGLLSFAPWVLEGSNGFELCIDLFSLHQAA